MKTIVVDDDQLSRKVVEEFVKKTEVLTFLNSYSNAVEAINGLSKSNESVDLIFLDVEMPGMSGIEFLNSLEDVPYVVIVSAKESYALEAFEYDVTDYMLKPISYSRFFKAVTKVLKRFEMNDLSSSFSGSSDEIFIKKDQVLIRLNYNDILYVEALENYVIVTTFDERLTIHFSMKSILDKLPESKFKRVHRSFITNIKNVKEIESDYIIVDLEDGPKRIPIGKSYRAKLMKDINLMR